MAKTARDVMSPDAECIGESDSVLDAARKLRDLGVGSMPICGEDDRLNGMLTDRDIVVKVLAEGKDPAATTAGELGEGKPVTIGADDSVEDALRTMTNNKVRRLPVIDGHDLVGIVSQADLARNIDEEKVGELVEAISSSSRPSARGAGRPGRPFDSAPLTSLRCYGRSSEHAGLAWALEVGAGGAREAGSSGTGRGSPRARR